MLSVNLFPVKFREVHLSIFCPIVLHGIVQIIIIKQITTLYKHVMYFIEMY